MTAQRRAAWRENTRVADALAILDDGLAIYRANVARFLLITLLWIIPVVLTVVLIIVVAESRWLAVGIGFLGLVAAIPAFNMAIVMLARATRMAMAGEPIRLRATFGLPAWRTVGMGCFAIVYLIVVQLVASSFSTFFFCLTFVVSLSGFGMFASTGVGAFAGIFSSLIFGLNYLLSAAVGGAAFAALVHSLQPWALEDLPTGQLFGRGVDTTTHRIGYNLVVWLLAGLLYSVILFVAMLSIGVFAVIPLFETLEDSLVNQAIVAVAWLVGAVVALPLLPIWMTLLYTRKHDARAGGDLGLRIKQWRAKLDS